MRSSAAPAINQIIIPIDPVIFIDPTDMSMNQMRIVECLFEQAAAIGLNVFHKSNEEYKKPYTVALPNAHKGKPSIDRDILFTHTIVQDSATRFRIISNKEKDELGKGAYGHVVRIVKTIKRTSTGLKVKVSKQLVVKISNINTRERLEFVSREGLAAHAFPHLVAGELIFEKSVTGNRITTTYLVMKELGKQELFTLLECDIVAKYKSLTLAQRLRLSVNLPVAVHDQIHAMGYIHRDLKPENLRIDDEMKVAVIDVGFAENMASASSIFAGSLNYIPIEAFENNFSAKIVNDYYSLGLILLVLWMGNARNIKKNAEALAIATLKAGVELAKTAKAEEIVAATNIDEVHANAIVTLINGMLLPPAQRLTTVDAERVFRNIELCMLQKSLESEFHQPLQQALTIGLETKNGLRAILSQDKSTRIENIDNYLQAQLSKMIDHRQVIEYFIVTAELHVFKDLSFKQQIIDKLRQIIADYHAQLTQLNLLEMKIKKFTAYFAEYDLKRNPIFNEYIDGLKLDLESLVKKNKKEKRTFSLEDIVCLTQKYRVEIKLLQDKFKTVLALKSSTISRFKFFEQVNCHQSTQLAFHQAARINNTL